MAHETATTVLEREHQKVAPPPGPLQAEPTCKYNMLHTNVYHSPVSLPPLPSLSSLPSLSESLSMMLMLLCVFLFMSPEDPYRGRKVAESV